MIQPRAVFLLAAALLTAPLAAQPDPAPTGTSKPQPLPIEDTIPAAKDVPYPGTLTLHVDATDVAHGVFRVTETVPAAPGHLVLLLPKWLPGAHAPVGVIDKLAGLVVTAGGRPVPWKRDPVDVAAFHLDVPQGASGVDVAFQYLSPTTGDQGRVVMTGEMLNLQWDSVALYPAGYFVRQIMVRPSATYPAGWTSATALRPSGKTTAAGGRVDYNAVAFDTLVDSPVFAGRYARVEALTPQVTLNVFADKAGELAIAPEQLAAHKALIAQALKTFGAQHYDHYDFLLAVTDRMGGIGLEHHRSSEDGTRGDYFTAWKTGVSGRDLLAHEYTHSWNGKFRRPADLWTPDYRYPMRDSLLWVYEGQTQFWGQVLAARSGLIPRKDALDSLAAVAASYDAQAGRTWRPLADTTSDEIINPRRPQAYRSWQRFEDYYAEGQLIWLDADSIIREKSGGRRSLDDFARAFFGVRDGDWGELTYTFDEVVAALDKVQPYDWASFLHARVDQVAPKAPLDGLARGGYRLVYTDEPGDFWTSDEKRRKSLNLSYSLGMTIGKEGRVTAVAWNGPAFKAGIAPGARIVAIAGQAYDDDDLKAAITAAKGGTAPIPLLIEQEEAYRTVPVAWGGGLRYPHLERTGKGPSSLDALYAPRG